MWWDFVKCEKFSLIRQIAKKIVPINTCKPWNPVATKKVEPYTESAIQKGASIYSIACNKVKKAPKKIVKLKLFNAWSLLPQTKLWCAQVTVAPELNNIAVFNNGTPNGFKALIPFGGHITPISTEGDKLLWKKAQKNEKKNKISETINKIKPNFKPLTVARVWNPINVLSRTTSFNHKYNIIKRLITPKLNKKYFEKWK